MLGVIDGALSVSDGARRAIDGALNAMCRAQRETDGLLKAIDGALSVMSGARCVTCGAWSAIDGIPSVMCGAKCEKDGFPNAIDGAQCEGDGAWRAISGVGWALAHRSLAQSSSARVMHRNSPSSALVIRRQVSMRVTIERGTTSVFSLVSRTHISLPHCMTNAGRAVSAVV